MNIKKPSEYALTGAIGALVCAAKNRDAAREDHERGIDLAHSALFEASRARDAEWLALVEPLVEALALGIEWTDEYSAQMASYTVSDVSKRDASKMRKALANITKE